jgi:predicted ferric reductase
MRLLVQGPSISAAGAAIADTDDARVAMLFLVMLLIVLWFLGLMSSYTFGGLLHILLVVAVILFLVHVIQGSSIGEA